MRFKSIYAFQEQCTSPIAEWSIQDLARGNELLLSKVIEHHFSHFIDASRFEFRTRTKCRSFVHEIKQTFVFLSNPDGFARCFRRARRHVLLFEIVGRR